MSKQALVLFIEILQGVLCKSEAEKILEWKVIEKEWNHMLITKGKLFWFGLIFVGGDFRNISGSDQGLTDTEIQIGEVSCRYPFAQI
jgi:hypothetical protein